MKHSYWQCAKGCSTSRRRNLVRSDGPDRLFTKWRVSQSFFRGPAPGRSSAAVMSRITGQEHERRTQSKLSSHMSRRIPLGFTHQSWRRRACVSAGAPLTPATQDSGDQRNSSPLHGAPSVAPSVCLTRIFFTVSISVQRDNCSISRSNASMSTRITPGSLTNRRYKP